MEVTTINAELFARMFLAGANNLGAKREWINERMFSLFRMEIPVQTCQ